MSTNGKQHVVIIGGGFAGLYAAQTLGRSDVRVTIVDKRNFHLFQPLLYQVATGGLSPGDIASPLRGILNRYKNIWVRESEATGLDPVTQTVYLDDGELHYDVLIVATGTTHAYFGHDEWERLAPGLKTIEDALTIRGRIFRAFEEAEWATDPNEQRAWMTFVIVGAGPTGVELAGALAELAHYTLKHDFRNIDPRRAQILLVEGVDRVLPPYTADLSAKAAETLESMGVTIRLKTMVTDITEDGLTVKTGDQTEFIPAKTVLWGAGMRASSFARTVASATGAETDRAGRLLVQPDLTLKTYPNIFVIGDLAYHPAQDNKSWPGVAQVAMQQGAYVAKLIRNQIPVGRRQPFKYNDKGSLAVIGRNRAVADLGFLRMSGVPAWLIWVFIHIAYLIEFDNKLRVMLQWGWNYLTRNNGARLITGDAAREPDAVERQV